MYANFPIKDTELIDKIKDLFLSTGNSQGYLLFVLAINTGINLKDLLKLKVQDIKNKKYIVLGKDKSVPLDDELQEIIKDFTVNSQGEDYLFKTKTGNTLDRIFVFNVFKSICTKLGVQDRYSVASWRKTFAYHYYIKYKDLSYLQWLFNQSTVKQTLNYIGVDENMNLRFREGVSL